MDRRNFLKKSAALGTAAALAKFKLPGAWASGSSQPITIPSGSLIRDFANNPDDGPIDTIVVLMMENRSVDHYFGWLGTDQDFLETGVVRYQDPGFHFDGDNQTTFNGVSTHQQVVNNTDDEFRGCGHPDPGHGWTSGWAQLQNGFLAEGSGNDEYALGYHLPGDIPAYEDYARRFTTFDRYFCSALTSTFPNREYLHSAQSGGVSNNDLPTPDNVPPRIPPDNGVFAFQWDTIWDRLRDQAGMVPGIDAGYFFVDLPAIALWGERMLPFTQHIEEYFARAATGTLPRVTFIDPGFTTGLRTDDHPYADIRAGQKLVGDYVKAFVESPHWKNGVMFITYDEWGGFFDRVTPPTLPDNFAGQGPARDDDPNTPHAGFEQAGFRVPTMMLSPYAKPGFVDHRVYDHTSILRFLEWRFLNAPPDAAADPSTLDPFANHPVPSWALTQRDATAQNIGASLGSENPNPDFEPLLLPEIPITSAPCEGEALEGTFVDGIIEDAIEPVENQVPLEEQEHAFEQAMKAGFFERVGFDPSPYLSRKLPTL